jgi:ribulose kinase
MSRVLGLDFGSNSIGWAIIDNETNSLLNSGMRVFKASPKQRVIKKRENQKAFISLNVISITSLILVVLNFENWQFWLNITLTSVITKITLSNQ